jgi:hypothetical protein
MRPAQPTALPVSAHIRHFLSIFPSKPFYLKIKAATGTFKNLSPNYFFSNHTTFNQTQIGAKLPFKLLFV